MTKALPHRVNPPADHRHTTSRHHDHRFGISRQSAGVVGIPITDLARIAQSSGIRYIGFRQETSAGNAAAAAGFLTRHPGVCLTVSAPGLLNDLAALANATTNCCPMIQISGSSNRAMVDLQRGEYGELDQLNAARPFVKAPAPTGNDPAPTVLNARARHELIAEAFGGKGYHVITPSELRSALAEAIASNGPSIIDCELDPAAGVKSGHPASLNPTSAAALPPSPLSAGA